MGRKNIIKSYKMLDAVTIDSTQTSDKTNVESMDVASVDLVWSGGSTPIGAITFESTNSSDNDISAGNDDWVELEFGSVINISGASGSHHIVFNVLPFRALRVKYTRSSGSATLDCTIHSETRGA